MNDDCRSTSREKTPTTSRDDTLDLRREQLTEVTRDDFLQAPVGSFVRGRNYVLWIASPTLGGGIYHGTIKSDDIKHITPLLDAFRRIATHQRINVLTDTRHIQDINDSAYSLLMSYVRRGTDNLSHHVDRHAILHRPTDSLTHIAISSLYLTLKSGFATTPFVELYDALQWLGLTTSDGLGDKIRTLTTESTNDVTSRLRMLLANRHQLTLSEAAESLNTSTRSLQRSLAANGSNFRNELNITRARLANEAAGAAKDKQEALAGRLGLSRSTFCRALRRFANDDVRHNRDKLMATAPTSRQSIGAKCDT